MTDNTPLLQVDHVAKSFVTGPGVPPLAVLNDVNMALQAGDAVAITGPSGSGKSTLLNIIGTLDTPTSGRVMLKGQNTNDLPEPQLADLRNRTIGFVFQRHHLLPQLTILENVLVPTLAGLPETSAEPAQERAVRWLKRVGLADRLTHRPGQLSGGECQRVALVRALINQPALLLADEPTGALDRQSAAQLMDLLVELNQTDRITIILVSHAPATAARMGRQLVLRDGSLLQGDAP